MKIDLMQLEFIDEKLRMMALEVENRFGEKTITSLYRIGDQGVHGTLPLRGIDIRCKTERHGREVEKYINNRWEYDKYRPEMKCCIFHNVGRGYHIHLQVHFNTQRVIS